MLAGPALSGIPKLQVSAPQLADGTMDAIMARPHVRPWRRARERAAARCTKQARAQGMLDVKGALSSERRRMYAPAPVVRHINWDAHPVDGVVPRNKGQKERLCRVDEHP